MNRSRVWSSALIAALVGLAAPPTGSTELGLGPKYQWKTADSGHAIHTKAKVILTQWLTIGDSRTAADARFPKQKLGPPLGPPWSEARAEVGLRPHCHWLKVPG